jgi:hypothetical protein
MDNVCVFHHAFNRRGVDLDGRITAWTSEAPHGVAREIGIESHSRLHPHNLRSIIPLPEDTSHQEGSLLPPHFTIKVRKAIFDTISDVTIPPVKNQHRAIEHVDSLFKTQ